MPTATMITGVIMGEMRMLMISVRPGMAGLDKPSALSNS